MFSFFLYSILLVSLLVLCPISSYAQGADQRTGFERNDALENLPRGARESQIKLQIEQSKKDYEEMIERGKEVRRLAERLARSFAQNGRFSEDDQAALEAVERNAKKIRSELGGSDDDEKIEDLLQAGDKASFADAVGTLKDAALNLADELTKTTRFSISATAIQSSNAVLTVARFLRIKN